MNCQKFESLAAELARGEMMEVDVLVDARAHEAECANCSSRLRDEEMLSRGLHALAIEMNSLQPSAFVEERLLATFRQPSIVVPITPTRNYRPYWLTAVAAILLIVVGLVAMVWRGSDKPKVDFAVNQPTPEQPNEIKTPKNAAVPERDKSVASLPPQTKPKRHLNSRELQARNSRTIRPESAVTNHASNEVATDFMPLGYLNPASLQDGGQIVRVEVPRTTMASFGFPVNMDRYNERVKADVLLGVDGVPHAIRFVQDKRSQ
jgi:hypothetical protein